MEHHINWLTALVNAWLGQPVAQFLNGIGIHPHDPAHPIPNHVVMSLVVVVFGMMFVMWLKPRLSVERPGAAQQIAEILLTNPLGLGIRDLLDENVGHAGRKYLPLVGTVSIFILLGNSISLFPAFDSPIIDPTVPLGCAVVTFLYYNWQGLRHHGLGGYTKQFMGPVHWVMGLLLMLPVELISHTARMLSLTVRLWANIFSSELLYFTFLGLLMAPGLAVGEKIPVLGWILGIFPALLPIAFVLLHAFVAVVQAFVFTILPTIYLGMAVAEEH